MSKSARSRKQKPSVEVQSSFFIKQADGTEIEVDEATWKVHLHQHIASLPDNDPLKKLSMRLSLAAFMEAAHSNPTGPEAKLIEDDPARFMAMVHDFERKGWIPALTPEADGADGADGADSLGGTVADGAGGVGSAGQLDDPRAGAMRMEVTIREATLDDAPALIEQVRLLTEEPDIDIPLGPGEFTLTEEQERQVLAEYAAAENSVFLMAEVEGKIVGMLNCQGGKRKATRHAVTLGLSVRKEYRNQGVGGKLMEQAVAWAKGTGVVTRIELAVYARNARAIHLYERFGFVVEGQRQRAVRHGDVYLDDLIMALLL
jgi:RimJ/RimL family protein N-acetyltransferase